MGISLRRRLALELDKRQQDQQIQEHQLTQLFWECTMRCNLACKHCGSDCHVDADVSDMPLNVFLPVLDNIAANQDPHNTFVIVTGGEPLMRSDIVECGREIYKRGFPWGMVTNGFALDAEMLKQLIGAGLHSVTISLDGFEAEHNWMRGNNESFARAAAAIRLVSQEKSIVSDVVTCVNQRNFDYLPEIKDYLLSLGVTRWRLFTVFPAGRAKGNPEMKLEPYQIRQLMEFIKQQRKEGKLHVSYGCEGFLGEYEGEVRDHFFSCQAGISVGSVRINGDIGGCLSIRYNFSQGNIYEGDEFMDVWNTCFSAYRNRDWMHTGICTHCKMFRYCRGNGMHLRDENGTLLLCNYYDLNK